jgi:hypothetical protein
MISPFDAFSTKWYLRAPVFLISNLRHTRDGLRTSIPRRTTRMSAVVYCTRQRCISLRDACFRALLRLRRDGSQRAGRVVFLEGPELLRDPSRVRSTGRLGVRTDREPTPTSWHAHALTRAGSSDG